MTAKQIVEQLAPGDGWWNSSTEQTLIEIADKMLAAGMDHAEVYELLNSLIFAIRQEYGD